MNEPSQGVHDAVAVVIYRDNGLVLAVKRPDEPGEELPGVWGLPATTLRAGETTEEGVRRVGHEKLDVELQACGVIGSGEQAREGYLLRMIVHEALMRGVPSVPGEIDSPGTQYLEIDWLPVEAFREAATKGSLCCQLLLNARDATRLAAP